MQLSVIDQQSGVRRRSLWEFDSDSAQRLLAEQFGTQDLAGFGCADLHRAIPAAGCLLRYVRETQRTALPHIRSIIHERREDSVLIDAAARRHLEIDSTLRGDYQHSLQWVIDKTKTAMGSRLLRRWLHRPLRDKATLLLRQQAIEALLQSSHCSVVRQALQPIGDMERILARVALRSARPRDLSRLRQSLLALPELQHSCSAIDAELIKELAEQASTYPDISELLSRAIIDNPPSTIREGGVIAEGYDAQLDELRRMSSHAGQFLLDMEMRERQRTGLSTLKVGYNRVHGYYIEISRAQSARAPTDYIRRQTLKNAERFITPELKKFEDQVLSAKSRALAREKMLYEVLLDHLHGEQLAALQTSASALATIDVLSTLAQRAHSLNLVRPELSEQAGITIAGGRHIVVEQVIDKPFIANGVELGNKHRLLIVTGPNNGREIDLYAADCTDRAIGAYRQFCTCGLGNDRLG